MPEIDGNASVDVQVSMNLNEKGKVVDTNSEDNLSKDLDSEQQMNLEKEVEQDLQDEIKFSSFLSKPPDFKDFKEFTHVTGKDTKEVKNLRNNCNLVIQKLIACMKLYGFLNANYLI